MKTKIIKTIITLMLLFVALPMMSQDYMNIHFKNGDFRKFYMKNVTEITTSKFDVDGVQHGDYDYQHITTIYDKYVYKLEDVESITFTKIDEQLAEHNFVTAMPIVFNTISDCETIDDVEDRIDIIKNAEGVEDAWSDGHILSVKIAEGEIYTFHFNHDANIDDDTYENAASQIKAFLPRLTNVVKEDGTQLKAVIANQQHKDENSIRQDNIKNFMIPLQNSLIQSGIHADYVDNPTIDFFYDHCNDPENAEHMNIYDYDIIFLITHGGYDNWNYYWYQTHDKEKFTLKWHAFLTSEDILIVDQSDKPNWSSYYQIFRENRDESAYKDATDAQINYCFIPEMRNNKSVWVAHPLLIEAFFRHLVPDDVKFLNPNSILFNVACESLKGDDKDNPSFTLADEFIKRNLGTYIAYDETNQEGQSAGYHFFTNMLSGLSLKQAYDKLSEEERHDHLKIDGKKIVSNLLIYPENNADIQKLFLLPVHTEGISNETANSEYKLNKTVKISGGATLINYGNVEHSDRTVELGFEITYYDPVTNTRRIQAETEPISYSNKVEFYANLNKLEPNRTYYYRAFTYDGMNYNYGEQYSFKIDKNVDDTMPTEGLVAYYPFNGNANDESGNGNHGSVRGNVVLTSDRFGNANSAYRFPGEPFNYISVPDDETLHCSTFTLNAWVYTDAENYGSGYLINKGRDINNGSYRLQVRSVGATNLYGGSNDAYIDDNPETGVWHMVTGTVEGKTARYYLDGVLMDERTLSYPFVYNNSDPLTLGMHYYSDVPSFWAYPLLGVMDDVRIYNRVLSPSEIKTLYHEPN